MSIIETYHSLRRWLKRYTPHSARLVFPILMGAVLIYIIFTILFFGGKRESLMASAESALLEMALQYGELPAKNPGRVVTISVRDTDLTTLKLANSADIRDAHIEEYATIVESVASHNPSMIVINWMPNAQPLAMDHLRPLTDVIDRLGIADKTYFALQLSTAGTVPPELSRRYKIAEARDCYYDVNLFCTFNSDWDWMPQRVANQFFTAPKKWDISTNLPHTLPNFVLNLPKPASLYNYSFLDFRPPVTADIAQGAAVFIGNDATQPLAFRNSKYILQRTYTAGTRLRRALLVDGMPFHIFWAAMAQMFIDQSTVAVVPAWICTLALILFSVSILGAIWLLGGRALGPFLVCATSLPIANMIGVAKFGVYMPVAPLIASGFAIFTAAAFVSVAVHSYRKLKLEALEAKAASTSDIKENFISLISHNLNTPIAQLRGLLDMLLKPEFGPNTDLSLALTFLEYLRVTVRAVLNTSTLGHSETVLEDVTVRKFWQTFLSDDEKLLQRFGISITSLPDENDDVDGEIWFYRFKFDIQTFSPTLLYAIVLLHTRFGAHKMRVHFAPVHPEPGDPKGLVIRIEFDRSTQSEIDARVPRGFMTDALSRFLQQVAVPHGCTIMFETSALILTLPDSQTR